MKITCWKSCK